MIPVCSTPDFSFPTEISLVTLKKNPVVLQYDFSRFPSSEKFSGFFFRIPSSFSFLIVKRPRFRAVHYTTYQ